jgi:uncharacterized membrane protein
VKKSFLTTWHTNFVTGLAVLLPAFLTIAIVKWIFGTVSSVTDMLLVFLPARWTHMNLGYGPMYWYWSLAALVLALLLVMFVGFLARYYIGLQLIAWLDARILRVPLLNKIYGTIKQVNEAFSSGKKTSFKTVVMVEFPCAGSLSMGFITGEQHETHRGPSGERLINVFIPTTPNPTSGFLVIVPESKVRKVDMSVAEGIKYIVSLGAIAPEFAQHAKYPIRNATGEAPAVQSAQP